jgi:uncharacterized membrane protein
MSEIIEQYINNVRKELYRLVQAEEYILDLQTNLEEFIQQFPDSTYSDLVEQFGSPKTVAEEFINNQKPNSPQERAKRRTKIRLWTIIGLIIIILLVFIVIALSINQPAYYRDTTIIEEQIEVSE